jgi:hypothetical protein
MSKEIFDDNCKGCRPAIIDIQTGKVLPDDNPIMKCALEVWAGTTLLERQAYHDVCCLNSREASDLVLFHAVTKRMQEALNKLPPPP